MKKGEGGRKRRKDGGRSRKEGIQFGWDDRENTEIECNTNLLDPICRHKRKNEVL
jgi:hypothetical protein